MAETENIELDYSDSNFATNATLKNDSRLTKVGVEED